MRRRMNVKSGLMALSILLAACGGGSGMGNSSSSGAGANGDLYPSYPYYADAGFGASGNGIAFIQWGWDQNSACVANEVVVQPDGKYLIVGSAILGGTSPGYYQFVSRFNADGSSDKTFGTAGITLLQRGSTSKGFKIRLLADGKMIVAGGVGLSMTAARLMPDGALDTTFADAGWFVQSNQKLENAIALQVDGNNRIYLVGDNGTVIRLLADGGRDTSWAGTGSTSVLYGKISEAKAAVLQGDKLLVAGDRQIYSAKRNSDIARFNADGTLDTSYGADGTGIVEYDIRPTQSIFTHFSTIRVDALGNTVAGGKACLQSLAYCDDMIVRFKVDGSLDASFASGGALTNNWNSPSSQINAGVEDLVLDGLGRIVTVSKITIPYKMTDTANFVTTVTGLARYTANGTPDTSFGVSGRRVTYAPGDGAKGIPLPAMQSIAIDANGMLMLAGAYTGASYTHQDSPGIMRLQP